MSRGGSPREWSSGTRGPLGLNGSEPTISFEMDESAFALRSRQGGFDFDPRLFSNMVELITNEKGTLYNFGPLLISKMEEIEREGQVYYWELQKKFKPKEAVLRAEYAAGERRTFVRMGDFSDTTSVGPKRRSAGDFDQLIKVQGTTNCSTAVLDALYRALGGRVDRRGRVTSVGGVNGVPLSDRKYSGFPKKFQGREWADAIVEYGLGYGVELSKLRPGDIISKPGHRMVVLKPIGPDEKGRPRILTIEARPPTGSAISREQRTVEKGWEAARIFDLRT
jgi:hypothetical protein